MGNNWVLPATEIVEKCSAFIAGTVHAAGLKKVVIGLSGGIDSAVAAALAVDALGKEKQVTKKPEFYKDNKVQVHQKW